MPHFYTLKEKILLKIGVFIFITLLFLPAVIPEFWGIEEIGSIFEKAHYKAKYYVYIHTYEKNDLYQKELSKELVQATITRSLDHLNGDWNSFIFLNSLYISSVLPIQFGSCKLKLNEIVMCYDEQKNLWYIELINKKVPQ